MPIINLFTNSTTAFLQNQNELVALAVETNSTLVFPIATLTDSTGPTYWRRIFTGPVTVAFGYICAIISCLAMTLATIKLIQYVWWNQSVNNGKWALKQALRLPEICLVLEFLGALYGRGLELSL